METHRAQHHTQDHRDTVRRQVAHSQHPQGDAADRRTDEGQRGAEVDGAPVLIEHEARQAQGDEPHQGRGEADAEEEREQGHGQQDVGETKGGLEQGGAKENQQSGRDHVGGWFQT